MKSYTLLDELRDRIKRPFRILSNKLFMHLYKQRLEYANTISPKVKEAYNVFEVILDLGKE